jgi:cytochrome oxidase Cu insertion factor (SCO1/SenC/PrrC family)
MKKRSLVLMLGVLAGVAVLGAGVGAAVAHFTRSTARPQAGNPLFVNTSIDPGTAMSGPAPNFTLTDQLGRRVSLRSFRGKVVLLAFNDPVCTTICPLTTTAMVEAKRLLGAAGAQVELLGIGANPEATEVKWVRDYSRVHHMLHRWHFLTGSLPQLKSVWKAYGIAAQVIHGEIDHTPALYVIDPRGRLRKLYLTQMAYAGVGQQARILAEEASSLLPGHPALASRASYGQVPPVRPTAVTEVPRAGGGTVRLGPGTPHLYLFFATWVSETTNLRTQLEALDGYQALAKAQGLPQLTAVDEASVEPSSGALPELLASLPRPLSYPVAIDEKGRVADGYRVLDQPWLTLVSRSGHLLWYHDVSAAGWLGTKALAARVRAALAHAAK